MTQPSDTKHHRRRWLATLLGLAAVGLALLVIAIAASGGHSNAATVRASNARSTPPAQTAKPSTHASSAIPQQNGGDGDPDNNGGPDDGDGDI